MTDNTVTATTTINYDRVANAIVHSVLITPEFKEQVKTLIMKEQAEVMTAVLRRLNSDEDGRTGEMIRCEPTTLIAMLLEEHARRLEELLLLGEKKEKENDN